jgi:transcriptional regulator with XRE-family HTH domain
MTPARLRECRKAIGWTGPELSRRLGASESLVRKMEVGQVAIPPSIERWLERVAAKIERTPPPTKWRVNSGYSSAPIARSSARPAAE